MRFQWSLCSRAFLRRGEGVGPVLKQKDGIFFGFQTQKSRKTKVCAALVMGWDNPLRPDQVYTSKTLSSFTYL